MICGCCGCDIPPPFTEQNKASLVPWLWYGIIHIPRKHFTVLSLGKATQSTPSMCVSLLFLWTHGGSRGGWWGEGMGTPLHRTTQAIFPEKIQWRGISLQDYFSFHLFGPYLSFYYYPCPKNNTEFVSAPRVFCTLLQIYLNRSASHPQVALDVTT